MDIEDKDIHFMRRALRQAQLAQQSGEVPVGAVAVAGDAIIAEARNQMITNSDPTAHAEIGCLREAARHFENYRLPDVDIYVTLEPCAMCYGAMVHARIRRLVFGAPDAKSGVLGGQVDMRDLSAFNHRPQIVGGVLAEDSATLLKEFFRRRR